MMIEWSDRRGDPRMEDGCAVAAGRCMGADLRVGDVFTVATAASDERHHVHLRIDRILLYEVSVTSVQSMESCELWLSGTGRSHVTPQVTLTGTR